MITPFNKAPLSTWLGGGSRNSGESRKKGGELVGTELHDTFLPGVACGHSPISPLDRYDATAALSLARCNPRRLSGALCLRRPVPLRPETPCVSLPPGLHPLFQSLFCPIFVCGEGTERFTDLTHFFR